MTAGEPRRVERLARASLRPVVCVRRARLLGGPGRVLRPLRSLDAAVGGLRGSRWLAGLLLLGIIAGARAGAATPELSYRIEARLHPSERVLIGRQRVLYRSDAEGPLERFLLHLRANRFRDRYSTAAREQAFYHDDSLSSLRPEERGYIDVESLRVNGRETDFRVIDTLLSFELDPPLEPGRQLELEIEFFLKLRQPRAEQGGLERHHELVDWYPRVALHDRRGWRAEPFHDRDGFNGVFADYDVELTLPAEFAVVAGGELRAGQQEAGAASAGPRTGPREAVPQPLARSLRLRQRRALDFSWVADSLVRPERLELASGVLLEAWLRPPHSAARGQRLLQRAQRVLGWLEQQLGPYPYSRLVLVESGAAGVEPHPGLLLVGVEDEASLAEALARQWTESLLGSDGVYEPWIGAGLAASLARRMLSEWYGPSARNPADLSRWQRWLLHTPERDRVQTRVLKTALAGLDEPVASAAHAFRDRPNVRTMARDKASLLFDRLHSLLGPEAFGAALRELYRRHALARDDGYGRLSEAGLRETFERFSEQDLGAVFDWWLRSVGSSDLAVAEVEREAVGAAGFLTLVGVRQRRAAAGPVEIELDTGGGGRPSTWLAAADAPGRDTGEQRTRIESRQRPQRVLLDPEAGLLDASRLDDHSPRRLELVLDRPLQTYWPRDRYVIAWRPEAWYNEVDGLRAGLRLRGGQEGWRQRLKLAASYGFESERVDVLASYRTPVTSLGRAGLQLLAASQEGRRGFEASMGWNLSPRHERRPQTLIEVGLSSYELTHAEYVRPEEWELGLSNALEAGFEGHYAGSGWRSEVTLRYSSSGRALGSDFSFQKLAAQGRAEIGSGRSGQLLLRSFLGLSSDGQVLPRHERFYLGGANPRERWHNPGLRSRDSLLELAHYHLPGDGNMRGYALTSASARRLFSVNTEYQQRLYRSPRRAQLPLELRLAGFFDFGKAEGTGDPELSDPLAGVGAGLRLDLELAGRRWQLRLDLPFWLNRPAVDWDGQRGDETAWRWLIGLGSAL